MPAGLITGLVPGLVEGALHLLDRLIPDEAARAEAKRRLVAAEGQQALAELQLQLSAILAEAASPDPWTSRARPAFLYVVYTLLLAGLPMGLLSVVNPEAAKAMAAGFAAWLNAIPEPIVTLFSIGYLGYTGARSVDKWKAGR
jgi:hypothetical protein